MMNRVSLRAHAALALAGWAWACPGLAANLTAVSVDACTGVRQTSETDGYTLTCSDNFTLSHGTITSDVRLVIVGTSSVTMSNVKVVAPSVEIRSNGNIAIGSDVEIDTGSAAIGVVSGDGAPSFYAGPAATISIDGAPAAPITLSSGALVATAASDATVSPSATVSETPQADQSAGSGGGGGGSVGAGLLPWLMAWVAGVAWLARRRPKGGVLPCVVPPHP